MIVLLILSLLLESTRLGFHIKRDNIDCGVIIRKCKLVATLLCRPHRNHLDNRNHSSEQLASAFAKRYLCVTVSRGHSLFCVCVCDVCKQSLFDNK